MEDPGGVGCLCHHRRRRLSLPIALALSPMKRLLPLLVWPALFLCSCERPADTKNPKQYSKNGVGFSYPGNWKVTEEEFFTKKIFWFYVESPGDSWLFVESETTKQAQPLKEYAKEFGELQSVDYWFWKFQPQSIKPDGAGGLEEKAVFWMAGEKNEYYTRHYRTMKFGKFTLYLVAQYPDADRKKVQPGFDAIIQSFQWQPGGGKKKKKTAKKQKAVPGEPEK